MLKSLGKGFWEAVLRSPFPVNLLISKKKGPFTMERAVGAPLTQVGEHSTTSVGQTAVVCVSASWPGSTHHTAVVSARMLHPDLSMENRQILILESSSRHLDSSKCIVIKKLNKKILWAGLSF